MDKGKRRIGIVYYRADVESCAAVRNMVVLFRKTGYLVDLFTKTSENAAPPTYIDDGVKLFERKPRWDKNGIHRVLPVTVSFPIQVFIRHSQIPYAGFIAIDPPGLEITKTYAKLIDVPLIYYSLELVLSDEINHAEQKRVKMIEKHFTDKFEYVIIQDELRGSLLSKDLSIPIEKFVFLPNSRLDASRKQHSGYWHHKFDLRPETRVVLHSGSLSGWTKISEIAGSAGSWPEGWVLVIHASVKNDLNMERIAAFQKSVDLRRVFFSTEPVTDAENRELTDGADIGIAFYEIKDGLYYTISNHIALGHASGKVNTYLHSGLPIIMNDTTSTAAENEREGCGKTVNSPAQIGTAIGEIAENYETYSKNAVKHFNSHLRFEDGFTHVLSKLEAISENTNHR